MRHCQCLLILLIIIHRLTIKGRNEVTVDLHLFLFKIKHNGPICFPKENSKNTINSKEINSH